MDLLEDDVLVGSVSVTRTPGSPNDQTKCAVIEVDLLAAHAYRADVTFEPVPGAKKGSNTVWVLVAPMKTPTTPGHALLKFHHVFHVGDPSKYLWTVPLPDLAPELIGGCGCDDDDEDDDHDDDCDDEDEDDECDDEDEDDDERGCSGSHDGCGDDDHGAGSRDGCDGEREDECGDSENRCGDDGDRGSCGPGDGRGGDDHDAGEDTVRNGVDGERKCGDAGDGRGERDDDCDDSGDDCEDEDDGECSGSDDDRERDHDDKCDDEDEDDDEDHEHDDDSGEKDDHDEGCGGVQIHTRVTATDRGTDDLTFTWTFPDGAVETQTFFNDGVSPDPRPSSLGVRPFTVTDTIVHSLRQPCGKQVTLSVSDDDGGVTTIVLTIRP
jgi:hypothetical protein